MGFGTQLSGETSPPLVFGEYRIEKAGRYWKVMDGAGLVCITVYLKGAKEIARRLGTRLPEPA